MAYDPKPIDNSRIELSAELNQLVERLAANNHDLWARRRVAEGWQYGPLRDDEGKQTPVLVPYEDLPDSEKHYDRENAIETLKTIVGLGWMIQDPQHEANRGLTREEFQKNAKQANAEGEALLACDIASDGLKLWPGDAKLCQMQTLALARMGSRERAHQILNQLHKNAHNTALDKALSPFHLEHRFFASGVWELPYGRGRSFGSNIGRLADAFLGGWQTSAFVVLETGNPLTITTLGDNLHTGGGYLQVLNAIGQPNLPDSERTRTRFFRTDVFLRPALYTIGNAGRNTVIGPGSHNLDLSVGKQFAITERMSMQFRAELFNVFNHPNWGTPGTTLGTAAFGVITSNSNLPRDIQFGLKLRY